MGKQVSRGLERAQQSDPQGQGGAFDQIGGLLHQFPEEHTHGDDEVLRSEGEDLQGGGFESRSPIFLEYQWVFVAEQQIREEARPPQGQDHR